MGNKTKKFILFLIVFLLAGCSRATVIQPTYQELEAARRYKKTTAILEITDKNSEIRGVGNAVRARLENHLMRYFNLVERDKIKAILTERNFSKDYNIENYREIGKMLGADFLIFGYAAASLSSPELDHYRHTYDSGKFRGRIWEKTCAQVELGLKMVDVGDGIIVYSNSKSDRSCKRNNKQKFEDQSLFEKTLKTRTIANQFIKIADRFSRLQKGYAKTVSQAIDDTTEKLTVELKNVIPQTGQILRFVNKKDVVINLGSAYGVRPGDVLVVWQESRAFTDPKTGIVTIPKEKKAYLKVIKVTSGLSSVARISKIFSSKPAVGNKVYTQR